MGSMQRRSFIQLVLPAAILPAPALWAQDEKPLRFGVIADPQYADKAARGSRHYRASIPKLQAAVDELKRHPLDFVVTLGDLIDCDLESFEPVMQVYAGLSVPHYKVYGNHDWEMEDADKPRVPEAMQMPKPGYYAIDRGAWKFLFLDGTEISTYRYGENDKRTAEAEALRQSLKKQGVRSAVSWNGAVSEQQLGWLSAQLEAAEKSAQKVIVMNHFPIMPEHDGHNLWNAEDLRELLAASQQVVGYFNGHNHKGGYQEHAGTHFLNFKGMVEGAKGSAYAVVSCYSDRIEVEGFSTEADRQLQV